MIRSRALPLLATLATLAGAGGCGPEDAVGPEPPSSAVGVRAAGCSLVDRLGTGVLIDPGGGGSPNGPGGPGGPGLVATVAHTVAGASTVVVVDQAGREHETEVVAFDPDDDVALLSLAGADLEGIGPSPLGRIEPGDRSIVVTWDPDEGFSPTEAEVTRRLEVTIEDIYVDQVGQRQALELAMATVRGDSGAPVYNERGEVAGIVYARSRERDGIGFALAGVEIEELVATTDRLPVARGRCL